jgi:hypothetical protein
MYTGATAFAAAVYSTQRAMEECAVKGTVHLVVVCVLAGGLLAGQAKAPAQPATPAPPAEDKPLRTMLRTEQAPAFYLAQLLGELDRPVGQGIKLCDMTIPARVGDKGQLELDLRGDGKFTSYRNDQTLNVSLKREGAKLPLQVSLFLKKQPDGAWTYRNVTQLFVRVESEQLALVDANGNGVYNEPNVDGVTLQGQTYLFPLPAPEERWCTPALELTGLTFGPWGEELKVTGRPLATKEPSGLPVLEGVIQERLKLGLTPRPEDVKLSADLQKHCAYMNANGTLTHPEDKGKPGFSEEGHQAGLRSILSMGTPAPRVAAMMVGTYFHRIDVIRPDTMAFGVGYDGRYGGIDGRTNLRKEKPPALWPVLCPAPGQTDVPLAYNKEMPDATPGDDRAGFPITVQFHTGKLKLTSHALRPVGPAGPVPAKTEAAAVDCYTYDPHTGASNGMTGFLRCVCIIAKEPLQPDTQYEVTMNVEVGGKPWMKTWRFTTGAGAAGGGGKRPRR